MTTARTLVKPYWIRIGSGGFAIETDKDLVRAFFGEMDLGTENQRAFELISTNPYGNLRALGYYWDAAYIEHEIVGKGSGLVMIPGDWPEPKDGPVWEHVVPFTPQPTACKAGKAQAHPGVAYRVRQGEQPWDVAMRFGQPYKAWVKLRQANHDDPAGFVRPAKDAGICTFADWRAGKWISIPKDWPLPEPQSPLWRDMTMARALGAVGAPNTSEALPPRKDTPMQPQTFPYRIQRGDTPGHLARSHGVTKDDLFRANPKMLTMRDRFGEKNFHPLSFQRGAVMNIPVPSGSVSAPSGAVGCGGGGCGYGLERSRRPYERQGCQCGSPGYCPSCGRDGALGACQCGQGYIGAPNGSGAVGAAGDPCPGGAAIADVKPYHYVVTTDDLSNFWKIPTKFGMPTKMGTKWTWQQMRDANKGWVGGVALDAYGACVLQGLYEGAKLLVPASWGEPQPGVTVVPIGTDNKCQAGYFEMGGQCVQLPPDTSLPIGGQCPAGTTNVAGICVPNLGYPMPQGGCLPGTTLDPADGMCKPPGVGPGEITFGVPPDSNGQCPTGMRLYSDNLCYVPGKQPSGLKLVTQTTDAEDEGIPTWVWVVGGIGAAAAAVGIAMMAGKKPDKKKPAREPEFFVEEEEVIG